MRMEKGARIYIRRRYTFIFPIQADVFVRKCVFCTWGRKKLNFELISHEVLDQIVVLKLKQKVDVRNLTIKGFWMQQICDLAPNSDYEYIILQEPSKLDLRQTYTLINQNYKFKTIAKKSSRILNRNIYSIFAMV
jgi:hypothetical protein